jgi:mannose-6-phosphate isomerase-like protein (cupin superfamily)
MHFFSPTRGPTMSRPHIRVPALAISLLVILAPAGAQQVSSRPTPDSPALHTSSAELAAALRAAAAQHAEPGVAAVGVTDQYQIHEVHRGKPSGPPAIHRGWTELHFILAGGGTLLSGGRIEARSGQPQGVIVGGKSRRVHEGDAVIIPPDTPHWYSKIDPDGLTYLEVRFATPAGS